MNGMMKHGFSLVEILVAGVIIASVGIVFTQALVSVTRSDVKNTVEQELLGVGSSVTSTFESLIRRSFKISLCEESELGMVMPDGNTVTLGCVGNPAQISSSSSTRDYVLTNQDIRCTNLQFVCEPEDSPEVVTVTFTLDKSVDGKAFEEGQETFSFSVQRRNLP